MRCEVCYTSQRIVFHTIKRLGALKEGFNVRNGNSLKAFGFRQGMHFPYTADVG